LEVDELSAFAFAQNHQAKMAARRHYGAHIGVHRLNRCVAAFAVAGIVSNAVKMPSAGTPRQNTLNSLGGGTKIVCTWNNWPME